MCPDSHRPYEVWTVAHQAPSVVDSPGRLEWVLRDLPDTAMEPRYPASPALQVSVLLLSHRKTCNIADDKLLFHNVKE